MKNLNIQITDELHQCLEKLGVPGGPLIEELLKKCSDVKAAKKELGVEWQDRPKRGRRWPKSGDE